MQKTNVLEYRTVFTETQIFPSLLPEKWGSCVILHRVIHTPCRWFPTYWVLWEMIILYLWKYSIGIRVITSCPH